MAARHTLLLIGAAALFVLAVGATMGNRNVAEELRGYAREGSAPPAVEPRGVPTPLPTPAPTPTPHPAAPEGWQRGFAFWNHSAPFGSVESLQALGELKAVGADTVAPVITWYVANPRDVRLHRGRGTPSDDDLVAAIEEAHRLGLRVVLRFHVDCEDGQWRATIDPDDKETWFEAYGIVLNHYANLARSHDVEGMVIGTELLRLTRPANTPRWRAMIAEVRRRFHGFLTYSAEWGGAPPDSPTDPLREYEQVGFWRDLDYLGISAYFELAHDGNPAPSPDALVARWEEWRRLRIAPFQAEYGMPLLFTEVGYASTNEAAHHPWAGGGPSAVDLQLQADLYRALFQSWAGVPWFRGAYFWFWATDADGSGPTSADYPPAGKPAERVIREWFARLDDIELATPWTRSSPGGTIRGGEGR